jgi:transposase InsO family protein
VKNLLQKMSCYARVIHTGAFTALAVRRQGFWDQWRAELRESSAHLVGFILRHVGCDASGAFRASFVHDGTAQHSTIVLGPMADKVSPFVKTLKRDYVQVTPLPDAQTVLGLIGGWIEDYNDNHPHSGLKMRSPREFIAAQTATA